MLLQICTDGHVELIEDSFFFLAAATAANMPPVLCYTAEYTGV